MAVIVIVMVVMNRMERNIMTVIMVNINKMMVMINCDKEYGGMILMIMVMMKLMLMEYEECDDHED